MRVKEGCAVDNAHFEGEYELVKNNVTDVNAAIEQKKMCVEHTVKKENEIGESLAQTLKDLVPQSKFIRSKQRLSQVRARAQKLVGEHESRTARYNKEAELFKTQDMILTHVMSTIENYYKHKSEQQKKDSTVKTVLLETVAPKSKVHQEVVTKLLEIVSKKQQPKKILAGQIYEAMQELKNTFEDERSKRTARYEARKGEHTSEIRQLTEEEATINSEVKRYLKNNKNVTAAAEALKKEMATVTQKMVECKKDMSFSHKKFVSLSAQLKTKESAMSRTKTLCSSQMKDIAKEIELAAYIVQLIDKRVHHIQQALVKYQKEANGGDQSMTGMSTGAVGDLEREIKSTEDCAKYSKEFWCASPANMKQCGVTAEECERMSKGEPLVQSGYATGGATGAATGVFGGSTGHVSATMAASQEKKKRDFKKVLRVYDQNKDEKIGIDEIAAVKSKAVAKKVEPAFKQSAGTDGKMDKHEFQKFMNGGKFFF